MSLSPKSGLFGAALSLLAGSASADIVTFVDDKAGFLSATSATSATGALVNTGAALYTSHTFGSVTLSNGFGYFISDIWTPDGSVDIAINGMENLDAATASPVYAFGFDFYEVVGRSTFGSPIGVQSTFEVTANNGESFRFAAAGEQWTFIGFQTDTPFSQVAIREISGGIDDEFFGQFYTSGVPLDTAPAAVPEPGTLALLGAGLALLAGFRKQSRKK